MDCFINSGIFLRANGSIRCGCDEGTRINLQPYNADIDYAEDLYFGKAYQKIRHHLKKGDMPDSNLCSRCALLSTTDSFNSSFADDRIIDIFQIEPSFACVLECPSCVDRKRRKDILPKTKGGHLILPLDVFNKILTDLVKAGIKIRKFSLEGHGEPVLNRHVWKIIELIKQMYPKSYVSMTTNAHITFKPEMLYSGLNELIFAIDGMSQETYEPYRKKGNFEKAYNYMKDFSTAALEKQVPISTVWKYVIFEHNDKPDNLLKTQELAARAGISKIVFVITCLGPYSKKIFDADQIPRIKNGPHVEVITNKLAVTDLNERIYDILNTLKNDDSDKGAETALYSIFEHLFSDREEIRIERYDLLKQLVKQSKEMSLKAHGQVIIAHDRLVINNIIRLDDNVHRPELIFDEEYYLAVNKDVAEVVRAGMFKSGFEHYRTCGREEGRRPYPKS